MITISWKNLRGLARVLLNSYYPEGGAAMKTGLIHFTLATLLVFACLILVAVLGCVVSPQPEPPAVDGERITIALTSEDPESPDPDTVNFTGGEGAASPAGATLSLINVDDARFWSEVTIGADGSFAASLSGEPGQEFRLQVDTGSRRSEPLRLVTPDEDGPAESVENPLEGCLVIQPGDQLDFGDIELGDVAANQVVVRNDCDEEVEIESIWLVLGYEDELLCDEELDECLEGETSTTRECEEEFDFCEEECITEYDDCIDSGEPLDECQDSLFECYFECSDAVTSCVFDLCDEQIEVCYEGLDSLHNGYELIVADEPLVVDVGTSRSFVVTFTPNDTGTAEDLLVLDIEAPEEERRVILLTATGVE